jgi:hypothetical protein
MNKNCLNCDKELIGKYCSVCGQKADTHRISFYNFIFHDVLHGTFHIEKGMLFTAKESLTRPGKAALDYIAGKRIRYYNVFYLILITIGLIIFLHHFYDQLYLSQGGKVIPESLDLDETSKTLNEIFSQKSKIIIFIFVPFAALNSFILFRKKKLNLSEHAIIAGMILLGMLLISALGNLFFYIDLIAPFSNSVADGISWLVTVLIILQIGFGYLNAFSSDYSKMQIAFRILLFFTLISFEIVVLFYIVFGFVSKWKFGTVHISPFG